MRLGALEIEPGEKFTPAELQERFDRGMTGRGIEICYDDDDQRYLRLFASADGPYGDEIESGQLTYIGEGQTGNQELKGGNRILVEATDSPLPIFFFNRESDTSEWTYQGLVDVLEYDYGPFEGDGRDVYRFRLQRRSEFQERVDSDESASDISTPRRTQTTRSRVIRNTQLITRLKSLYDNRCQLCGNRRQRGVETGYSEGHHLKPLGSPHDGPDVAENILILCPNHHADFDYGRLSVDPDSLVVSHDYDESVNNSVLRVNDDHSLEREFLEYHNRHIADF